MTIEELVQCDASTLEAMSDADLLKHFEPMLNVTRPERASAVMKRNEQQLMAANPKLQMGMSLLKSMGVDMAGVFAPTKRRK